MIEIVAGALFFLLFIWVITDHVGENEQAWEERREPRKYFIHTGTVGKGLRKMENQIPELQEIDGASKES